MNTRTLAPIYLDNEPVGLQGDPKPMISKILAASGKKAETFEVRRLLNQSDLEGKPCRPEDIIDRTAQATTPIYLKSVDKKGQAPQWTGKPSNTTPVGQSNLPGAKSSVGQSSKSESVGQGNFGAGGSKSGGASGGNVGSGLSRSNEGGNVVSPPEAKLEEGKVSPKYLGKAANKAKPQKVAEADEASETDEQEQTDASFESDDSAEQ